MKQEDELESTDGIFDYVTEEEYSKIVKTRQSDQWIMDDGGLVDEREMGREGERMRRGCSLKEWSFA